MFLTLCPWIQAFSQHKVLAILFLEYILSILHKEPVATNDSEKGEITSESSADDCILQATMFALNAFLRYWLPFDGWLMVDNWSSFDMLSLCSWKQWGFTGVVERLGNKQLNKVTLLFFLPLYWSWEVFMVLLNWAGMNFYGEYGTFFLESLNM